MFKWLDGTFLLLPLKLHTHYFLSALSPSEMPQKGVDWLLGYESSPDWFLAQEMRRATNRGDEDMMEVLTTDWAKLPTLAPVPALAAFLGRESSRP